MKKPINHITFEQFAAFQSSPSFLAFDNIALQNANYPGKGSPLGLVYLSLKLAGEAGELANHVGKAMHDEEFFDEEGLSPERLLSINRELGDILWYIAALANWIGLSLESVATTQLMKLGQRTADETLQGDGDHR